MGDIDAWIENELKKGTPPRKIKQVLRTKGYNSDVISSVDYAETPLQKNLFSKIRRKNFLDVFALIIVIISILFGSLYSYTAVHKPSPEEIILNLSEVYGDVIVMKMAGNSMEPAFSDGQVIFVVSAYYQNNTPAKGDIGMAYFRLSDTSSVKRIAAAPMDKVDENEKYLKDSLLLKQLEYYNYTIPFGTVILLGDNQENSFDSRNYGLVSLKNIQGKIIK